VAAREGERVQEEQQRVAHVEKRVGLAEDRGPAAQRKHALVGGEQQVDLALPRARPRQLERDARQLQPEELPLRVIGAKVRDARHERVRRRIGEEADALRGRQLG